MRRTSPTPQSLCCVVCGETYDFEDETKASAAALGRLAGWSQSKQGWLCNWHIGEFNAKDRAKELAAHLERHTDLRPRREYKFSSHDYKVDFAFMRQRLAIEIEGGVWTNGRHTRGSGFIRDIEKYNALTLAGWRLLRYTPQMIADDPLKVIAEIEHVLALAN